MTFRPYAWILSSIGVLAACSSTSPDLTPAKLTGTYGLATLSIRLNAGLTESFSPPKAGSLELTGSTYKVFALADTGLTGAPDTVASDNGTYVVRGTMLIETSATGRGTDTATAMLRSHNDTLDVTVTVPSSGQFGYVWARTN